MRDNPKFWAKHVHPEDALRVFAEVERLIDQGGRNAGIPVSAQAGRLSLDTGYLQGCARKGRQTEGDRRFMGGHLRPEEYRGRAAATLQRGGAAQPIHSRGLWPISDG